MRANDGTRKGLKYLHIVDAKVYRGKRCREITYVSTCLKDGEEFCLKNSDILSYSCGLAVRKRVAVIALDHAVRKVACDLTVPPWYPCFQVPERRSLKEVLSARR